MTAPTRQSIGIIGDDAAELLAAMKAVRKKEFNKLSVSNAELTTEQKIELVRQFSYRKAVDLLAHIEQSEQPYNLAVIRTAYERLC